MLAVELLQVLADCQTKQDAGSSNIPFLADDSRGRWSTVPAGKKWFVHRIDIRNTSTSAATYSLWFVPVNKTIQSTTTTWLTVPTTSIVANSRVHLEASAGKDVLDILHEGDSIWHMGGGLNLNLKIIGWEVDA